MKYFFTLISFITLTFIINAQTTIPPGDVTGTWTIGGSPYEIQGEITIPNLETLTIEPGVMVEFQGHYKLNVQGRLFAIGTENDTIIFTINDTTGFHNPNTPDGGWAGIRFINVFSMIDSSSLIYCKIEYGKALGYWPDNTGGAICVDGFDRLTISNCLINNNMASIIDGSGGGIALWNSNPEINGNTISNNFAQCGGGIICYESSPQIVNSLIVDNYSSQEGGGIVCNEYSNPNILNTIIENNIAEESGGGIVCWNFSSPTLDDVTFTSNSATGWAGGGILSINCNLEIKNCLFTENYAISVGAAIIFAADTSLTGLPYEITINNTSIVSNVSERCVVGIQNWNPYSPLLIDASIDRCDFVENSADNYTGLRIIGSSFSISNCLFKRNTAVQYTAALGFTAGCIGEVWNCIFVSNTASTGGGGWNSGGVTVWTGVKADFMNCTFAYNSAEYGAGLTIGSGGMATITNCIFWGNNTNQIALDTYNNLGGVLDVNYCDIQGGEDSVNVIDPSLSTLNWGDGNISANPMFEDPVNDDYRLKEASLCIGAGIDTIEINGTMYYCPSFCYDGNPRPDPPGSMPDIGACESPLANPVGVENDISLIPNDFYISQNYPNPFNSATAIQYSIPQRSNVTLKVYDILGNEVSTLVNEENEQGVYTVNFDANNLASGLYLYRIQAGTFIATKKMILLK